MNENVIMRQPTFVVFCNKEIPELRSALFPDPLEPLCNIVLDLRMPQTKLLTPRQTIEVYPLGREVMTRS